METTQTLAITKLKKIVNEYILSVASEHESLGCVDKSFKTHEVCKYFIQKYGGLQLQFVPLATRSAELCLMAVKDDGMALQHVIEQTPEICLAAVQQNGNALQFVKDQTDELCIYAIDQCACALKHMRDQTPEICLYAYNKYGISSVVYFNKQIMDQIQKE